MENKKLGLLDQSIEEFEGEETAELFFLKDFQDTEGTSFKEASDFRRDYPNFETLVRTDDEVRVRLSQGLAWSKFMLSVLTNRVDKDPVRHFFMRSATHRVLFYVLFVSFLDQTLHASTRKNSKRPSDSIGASVARVEEMMALAEGESPSTIKRIIAEAVKFRIIRKSAWRFDKRKVALWLVPESMENYLTTVLEGFMGGASAGLPKARRDLLAAMENNPNFIEDVREKIKEAILADQEKHLSN
jgi:hypothetical protein